MADGSIKCYKGVFKLELENSGKMSFFGANFLYMTVMILFITIGYVAQNWNFHYGILVTEFLLIALPTAIYVKIKDRKSVV